MLNVVILAAGKGKRMRSNRPKVLHTLAGRSMLAHVMASARALSPNRMVVVTGHGAELVQAACAGQTDVAFALQEPQLGTGHAVQQAMPLVVQDGITLILYGDVPLVSVSTLHRLVQAAKHGLAILTVQLDDPTGYGRIVRDHDGRVVRIVEQKDATPEEQAITEVNTGILAVSTERLNNWLQRLDNHNAQNEYYLTDVIGMAVTEGIPVATVEPEAPWETLGVNNRMQQAELERIYQRQYAESLLNAGVTLADPNRIEVRGGLVCGRDVFIDVGCVFEGEVELADGVHIGPYCVLRNVSVGPGARVEAFSHIDESDIGAKAIVGPYARLRPGTRLGERSRIGNFVEVKNSTLGDDSKANHLSYVGDATVGKNVNIGAGTITCNYDGANKHRTVIEDDVFIGSDTQLVAPIRVGRGATLGAGTTLTRDAPAEQLTLTRAPQRTIENWKRPRRKDKS